MRHPSSPRRVVLVLGGNAFVSAAGKVTMAGQFALAERVLRACARLLAPDVALVIGHGNGPQVGHMLTRVERSLGAAYAVPLEVCVAETEGELGYVLLQSLHNVLSELGPSRPIASLLTQVRVDPSDPAFAAPDKPIGPVYAPEQAEELRARGFAVAHDVGRGLRRVVPSPRPLEILDLEVVEKLLALSVIVIACGGGGIPVVREGARLRGVDAVIDKDLTAALLADALDAELLLIVTGVPCAYLDYGKPSQRPLGEVTASELRAHAAAGHFAPGSMGPKLAAAAEFASRPSRRAIVCDPDSIDAALRGQAGTRVRAG